MNKEAYIFEVTEKTFPTAVIENSSKAPVVVAFIGAWSEHCMGIDIIFSSLANEFPGDFIFAKVDIDEQPELRKQYRIENVPTIIVFQNGTASRAELGTLNEDEARALLAELNIQHGSDQLREQARIKHIEGDTPAAIMLLTQAIQKHPSNIRVAMDMMQIFIDINELGNAQGLYNKLPERDRASEQGKSLNDQLLFAQAASRTDGLSALQQLVAKDACDLSSRFDLAVCLIAQHDGKQAMDHLLTIIQQDATFKEGAAREMVITIIRTFKANHADIAQEYQRKLNNLIAQ
ncbi:MAG: tetratricopeptide repeat protein [Thiotrichaceae bacterium]|nr:tetratricopeptide repeat protein [Thiotrichaceae bacterium]PCI14545.1 MAG: co-chaperone YbbN [Thiotrichales bacterium]